MNRSLARFAMPVETDDQAGGGGGEPQATEPKATKPASLEELLADLEDDQKTAILGEVSKARGEAKNLRTRLKELEPVAAAAEQARLAQQSAEQRALEQADTWKTRADEASKRAVRSEVRALASEAFTDPEDAAAFLNLDDYVDAQGGIDSQQIVRDLADLLERKPHLTKAAPGERRSPRPDPSQGSGARGPVLKGEPRDQFATFMRGQTGLR